MPSKPSRAACILNALGVLLAACEQETLTIGYVSSTATSAEPAHHTEQAAGDAVVEGSGSDDADGPSVQIHVGARAYDAGSSALVCAGQCIDVNAVVGAPARDYRYLWANGDETQSVQVCPELDTTLRVEVSAGDQMASASLALHVLDCSEQELRDGISECRLSATVVLPQQATAAVMGNASELPGLQFPPIVYYANGTELPAGHYRVEYAHGCFTCCLTLLDEFWLVGVDKEDRIVRLPGGESDGVFNVPVAECPARGAPFAPIEFDFDGGKLGVWLWDAVAADNRDGDGAGGPNPTWRLTLLSCP